MGASRLAIVTGSNKGIGYAVVAALCERFDGDVYLTARDSGRGQEAVRGLNRLGLKPGFHQLDVTDDGSVDAFRRFVAGHYAGVDVLVNNAGVSYEHVLKDAPFSERARETVRVNYFAVRRVCDALFPLLRPGARVVNVSSSFGRLSLIPNESLRRRFAAPDLTVDELDSLARRFVDEAEAGRHEAGGWPSNAYTVSKVALSALTRVQQRAFDEDGRGDVVVNSVHPGYVDTDLSRHKGPLTIEEGAEAPAFVALLPPGERAVRGQYVWCDKTVREWELT